MDSIIKSASQKIFILSNFVTPLVNTQSIIYFFLMAISATFTEPSVFYIRLCITKADRQTKDYEPV